jgi:hypothetical protein
MIDLFKPKKDEGAADVKVIRERLLQFVKDQLSRSEGGEGGNIKGLHLFFNPAEEDRHLYDSAVYYEEEYRFMNEPVQRIADDFALELPTNWTMETTFVPMLPAEAVKVPGLEAGVFIRTQKRVLLKSATAYLRILNGESENDVYTLESSESRYNIGRDKKVQSADGFFRLNHISFPATSANESNKFISRQHAHIRFDQESGYFLLFPDEGGIPPRNKIKVRSAGDATAVKLTSTRNGHALQEGDQIMLGESAIMEFSYLP